MKTGFAGSAAPSSVVGIPKHPDSEIRIVMDTRRVPETRRNVHVTPRQLEVLALLCEGLPNKLICRRLNISAGTAKAHISTIYRELGVSSRVQAVVRARQWGLICDEVSCAPELADLRARDTADRGGLRVVQHA